MSEYTIEVLETCGKEIKALKETIKYKNWEIDSLKEKNRALLERIEELESKGMMPSHHSTSIEA